MLKAISQTSMARRKTKTEVATIKLTPQVRAAWETAALYENRSLANMFEVALLDYVKRHRIAVPKAKSTTDADAREKK